MLTLVVCVAASSSLSSGGLDDGRQTQSGVWNPRVRRERGRERERESREVRYPGDRRFTKMHEGSKVKVGS